MNLKNIYSKIIRREIKRIQTDTENSRRQAQSIDNTIRDYEKKLSDLEHKLNFKCGLDLQLEEVNENLVKQTNECNVSKVFLILVYFI